MFGAVRIYATVENDDYKENHPDYIFAVCLSYKNLILECVQFQMEIYVSDSRSPQKNLENGHNDLQRLL